MASALWRRVSLVRVASGQCDIAAHGQRAHLWKPASVATASSASSRAAPRSSAARADNAISLAATVPRRTLGSRHAAELTFHAAAESPAASAANRQDGGGRALGERAECRTGLDGLVGHGVRRCCMRRSVAQRCAVADKAHQHADHILIGLGLARVTAN